MLRATGRLLDKHLIDKTEYRAEYRVIRKDGGIAYWEDRGVAMRGENGQAYKMIGAINDITERKRTEALLQESKAELQRLLESMTTAFVLFESVFADDGRFVSYRFVYINEAYERITGVKNDEVKGKTTHEVWPKTEPEWVRRYGEVAVTGVSQTFDMYHEPTAKHYHCNVYRPGDTQDRFCVVFEDITERKQAEEALRDAELKFRTIFDQSSDGILLAENGSRTFYMANNKICEMLGYTQKEIIKIGLSEIHLEKNLPYVVKQFERMAKNEISVAPDIPVRRKDGSIIYADINSSTVNLGGKDYIIGVFRDITERKHAEDKIKQLNNELEQRVIDRTFQLEASNKELASFAYSVSHDLRAPLRGIDGWSLALLEDYGEKLDDQARKYLHRVRTETQLMGRLIDDMLKLSRVTRAELKLMPIDLTAMAHSIAKRLQEEWPHCQIEFIIQPDLRANGDSQLIDIALSNLFDNAVKFTGTRSHARIEFGEAEVDGGKAFFVHDNGVGFDMAHAPKLFGAFQRLHKSSEFPGTGIGLATVQRIIHRHGGHIWANAQIDQGATFYFTLKETI